MSFTISHSISDIDMEILKDRLYDPNNQHDPASLWIKSGLTGKINTAYKRMKEEWIPKLMDDSDTLALSASKDGFVKQVLSHSLYQDRYIRESASAALLP